MMSNLKVEALAREFHYNGIRIPDPGPDLSVEQIRDRLGGECGCLRRHLGWRQRGPVESESSRASPAPRLPLKL